MNSETAPFRAHCERLIGQLPNLANSLICRTLDALRSAKSDMAIAPDRKLMFSVASQIQLHQLRLHDALVHRFQSEIALHRQGRIDAGMAHVKPHIDDLSLVDESTAEITIEVARTVQLIKMEAEWSLREFQSYTSALCGLTDIHPEANPFSPAAFARALSNALSALPLSEPERKLVLRVAGQELAQLLNELYTATSLHLKQEGVSSLAYKTIVNLNAPSGAHLDLTIPGALDAFLNRLPPTTSMSSSLVSTALDRAVQQMRTNQVGQQVNDPRVVQGLSVLLDRMVRESASVPALQPVVRSMQTCMLRLSLHEPQIAEDLAHPSWLLMNDIATYLSGFRPDESSEKRQFIELIQPVIDSLLALTSPRTDDFIAARQRVQLVIDTQIASLLASRTATLKALEDADHAETLKSLLKQQVEQHLAGHTIPLIVSDFLRGPWVDVMCYAMTQPEMDEAESLALINVVEDLVTSLRRPTTMVERDRLRNMLPHLTERLRKGMALIHLAPKQRGDLMEQLMVVHSRYLRSAPATAPAPPAAPDSTHGTNQDEIVSRIRSEHIDSVWARLNPEPEPHQQVGALPTIPMALDGVPADESDATQTVKDWVDSLKPGMWFKLSIQGEWINSRLIWISRHHRFFMLTGKHRTEIHTLPRDILAKLRAEGLATEVTQHKLVQKAMDSLMGDLGA